MRTLKFTKMQGAGNDFVMLDGIRQDIEPTPALIRYLADRRFGIGADQVLMVERARLPGVDFRYRIFNCDGDEVEQCGNGARCFAVFVREEGLTDKTSIRVETMKAVIEPEVRPDGRVTVNMGPARKAPEVLPFVPEGLESGTEGASRIYHAHLSCSDVWFSALSMGNPHAVVFMHGIDNLDLSGIGPQFEHHPLFPRRTNTEFVEVVGRHHLKMRVWERGNGETPACGTGACAAVVAAVENGYCKKGVDVTVKVRGGDLLVNYTDDRITLTGDCNTVYKGEIEY